MKEYADRQGGVAGLDLLPALSIQAWMGETFISSHVIKGPLSYSLSLKYILTSPLRKLPDPVL